VSFVLVLASVQSTTSDLSSVLVSSVFLSSTLAVSHVVALVSVLVVVFLDEDDELDDEELQVEFHLEVNARFHVTTELKS
jgi:hypothetical protein